MTTRVLTRQRIMTRMSSAVLEPARNIWMTTRVLTQQRTVEDMMKFLDLEPYPQRMVMMALTVE